MPAPQHMPFCSHPASHRLFGWGWGPYSIFPACPAFVNLYSYLGHHCHPVLPSPIPPDQPAPYNRRRTPNSARVGQASAQATAPDPAVPLSRARRIWPWGLLDLYMSTPRIKLKKSNPMWFLEGHNLITFFLNQLSFHQGRNQIHCQWA